MSQLTSIIWQSIGDTNSPKKEITTLKISNINKTIYYYCLLFTAQLPAMRGSKFTERRKWKNGIIVATPCMVGPLVHHVGESLKWIV